MTDSHAAPEAGSPLDRRTLMAALAPFQTPCVRRSVWQFASTFLAYIAVNVAMYVTLEHVSVWAELALSVLAAGLIVRLFIIQHDCGHGSFFRSRRANDLLGRFCSPFTWTPYAFWRRQHANHHASFNNLDRRETGLDLYSNCATLQEYQALRFWPRMLFRLTRHPLVTQLVLPPFVFLVLYRVPFEAPASWARERISVHATNLTLAAALGVMVVVLGFWPVVLVQVPIVAIAAVVGVFLFTIQHRFEETQWAREEHWSPLAASLEGSSYLKLPRVLQWFTGNIGFHHIHHLASRVPNYRLEECHGARPELSTVTTLTFWQALRATCYALWDEETGRMVRFPRGSRA